MAVNSQAGGMFMKPDMCIWIMWAPPNRCSLKTIGVLSAAVLMDYGVVGVVNYLGMFLLLKFAYIVGYIAWVIKCDVAFINL